MTSDVKPQAIYGKPGDGRFFSPFNVNLDVMERLLLINFDSDPDTLYSAFEPQVFDDPINGKGLMVIAYRLDGKVDVYYQSGLTLEHKDFGIVGKGLAELIETAMPKARFAVLPNGVDVDIAFQDKTGRPVELRIQESGTKPRKPFSLLAPLGSGTENPPSLPLVLLYGFYFVRRAGTEVVIKVDGRDHQPEPLFLPIDLSRVYLLRYADDSFPVTWNATHDGPLMALHPTGSGELRDGETIYDLVENDGHFEIREMRIGNARHTIVFTFSPPVPDVMGLKEGASVNGRFTIRCEESSGQVSGVYTVAQSGEQVEMTVHPCDGWQPHERKWSVKLMYFIIKAFKDWPKAYIWKAVIQPNGDEVLMQARWSRLEPPKGLRD